MNLISRDMDIITNAMVNNDLGIIKTIKRLLSTMKSDAIPNEFRAYATAKEPQIIRPKTAINVDILSFTTADIKQMIEQGKKAVPKPKAASRRR
jgi:hypothetical protein